MQLHDSERRNAFEEAGDSGLKKMHIPVPKPRSSFLSVACPNCGKETVIFSHTTTDVKCKNCKTVIAERTGSRAVLRSKEFKKLD
jgi:small subunit ribosomal protein S27e